LQQASLDTHYFSFLAQIQNSIATENPKYNQHGRTSATRVEIKRECSHDTHISRRSYKLMICCSESLVTLDYLWLLDVLKFDSYLEILPRKHVAE
jgi:hypothetical protein